MFKYFFTLIIILSLFIDGEAQNIKGNLEGKVIDQITELPIPFAHVILIDSTINIGSTTDENGNFILRNIPVGRHKIRISFIGYETTEINDVIVSNGINSPLTVRLTENSVTLSEVAVYVKQEKEKPLNQLATVSARQLNMEEAGRFAGGFDDPARMVTSFA